MSVKLSVLLFLSLVALFCVLASSQRIIQSSPETLFSFAEYRQTYQKLYHNDYEEKYRYNVFLQNLNKIEELKQLNPYATFGIGPFADLSSKEFAQTYGSQLPKSLADKSLQESASVMYSAPFDLLPPAPNTTFDWRTKNVVSPIKDQGQCGSCWAFSSTEVIESAYAITHGSLQVLSPQQMLDCSDTAHGSSCNGGYLYYALEYAETNAVTTAANYPYTGAQGNCMGNAGATVEISNIIQVTASNNDTNLAQAIKKYGPIAFGIWGDLSVLQNYQGGVLSGCPSGSEGHFMNVVGWQDFNGVPVWIVRNSWGASWGESGYVYFQRNVNCCGINSYAMGVTSK